MPGLIGFIGHFSRSEKVAEHIGWPAGNPFQQEVAFTNLALSGLCFTSIWIRGDFWLSAAILGFVFYLGAAYVHIRDVIVNGNRAPGNAGPVLYFGILRGVALVSLAIPYIST